MSRRMKTHRNPRVKTRLHRPYRPVQQQKTRPQPLTPPPYPYSYPPRPAAAQPSQGLTTASLATGICGLSIALLGGWLIYPALAAAVLGILAIIFAATARKKGNTTGQATAGLVLGILALVFGILFASLFYFVFSIFHYLLNHVFEAGVAVAARFLMRFSSAL